MEGTIWGIYYVYIPQDCPHILMLLPRGQNFSVPPFVPTVPLSFFNLLFEFQCTSQRIISDDETGLKWFDYLGT